MSSKRCNVIERDIEKKEAEMEKVPVRLQVDYFSGQISATLPSVVAFRGRL